MSILLSSALSSISASTFFLAGLFLVVFFDEFGLGFVGALVAFGALLFAWDVACRRVRKLALEETRHTPLQERSRPIPSQRYFQNRNSRLPTSSYWMHERNGWLTKACDTELWDGSVVKQCNASINLPVIPTPLSTRARDGLVYAFGSDLDGRYDVPAGKRVPAVASTQKTEMSVSKTLLI